jgi:hypothetical protein
VKIATQISKSQTALAMESIAHITLTTQKSKELPSFNKISELNMCMKNTTTKKIQPRELVIGNLCKMSRKGATEKLTQQIALEQFLAR